MVAVLASCGGNQVSLWNIPGDDSPIVTFRPEYVPDSSYGDEGSNVTSLSFNKTAQVLAASTASGIISIYSQNGSLHDTIRPDDPVNGGNGELPISCISFSSSGLSLCSGGEDRILRLWDCKRKEIVRVIENWHPL
jgi:WD40 repeat protein